MLHLKAVMRFWTISPRVPGLFPAEPLHGDSLKIGERLSLKLNTAAGLDGTGIAEPTESCTLSISKSFSVSLNVPHSSPRFLGLGFYMKFLEQLKYFALINEI